MNRSDTQDALRPTPGQAHVMRAIAGGQPVRTMTANELLARAKAQARSAELRLDALRQAMRDAPDANAACRILTGMDVPTLIQHNHGEFDA